MTPLQPSPTSPTELSLRVRCRKGGTRFAPEVLGVLNAETLSRFDQGIESAAQSTTEQVGRAASKFLERRNPRAMKKIRDRKGRLIVLGKRADSKFRTQQLKDFDVAGEGQGQGCRESKATGEIVFSSGSVLAATVSLVAGPLFHWLSVALVVFCGRKTFRNTYERIVAGEKPDMDVLNSVIVGGFLMTGHTVLASVPVLLSAVRQKLVQKIKQTSRKAMLDVYWQKPTRVRAQVAGTTKEIDLVELVVGQLVIVSVGETIPVDGVVVGGYATVDQHLLTGEFLPVERSEGDAVFALTVVLRGQLILSVCEMGASTAAAKIARTLNQTIEFKTGTQIRAEREAEQLISPALLLGGVAMPAVGLSGGLGILNAPPIHNMSISSAICMLSYLNLSSKLGILIKDGRTLDFLADIDTVLFDKTGTLTESVPEVVAIHAIKGWDENEILRLAASLEKGQDHPIAQAILAPANDSLLLLPEVAEREYRVGFGVAGRVNSRAIVLGSPRLMESRGITGVSSLTDSQGTADAAGHSRILLSVEGELVGAIELAPKIREGVAELVGILKDKYHKKVAIVSGDQEQPTRHLAASVGIDTVFAEVLPERKGEIVRGLQSEGRRICFVGDGINDSIALKAANVSISIKGAASIATDVAQVILMDGRIHRLQELFALSRSYQDQMKRTSHLVLAPPLLGIAGVLLLHFGFLAVVGLNQVGFIASIANSLHPAKAVSRLARPEEEKREHGA
jgi:heavy metal translocating P-type ATPase